MSEQKIISRKVAVFGVICVVLVALLIGNLYTSSNQISSLNSKVESLQNENLSLKSELSDKSNVIASLNSQITEKDDTISSLRDLLDTKDSEISSLNSQVTSLNNRIMNLSSQISNLQSQVTSLQLENENLRNITRLQMVSYLDINRPINIPANSSSPVLSYLGLYAGIITISFSATSGVYFVVYIQYDESFFPPVNIKYRFPEQGTFTEGIFSFPILPGFFACAFQIVNPSSVGVSALITVKYTY
jgi:regulator of replication initiation timing